MKTYQYVDPENTVVAVFDEDGISRMSMLASLVPDGMAISPYVAPTVSAEERREQKFEQRAQALIRLRAKFSATLAGLVENGTVTQQQLRGLLDDPAWKAMQAALTNLQFEDAITAVAEITHPLGTAQVKAALTNRIQNNLFNDQ